MGNSTGVNVFCDWKKCENTEGKQGILSWSERGHPVVYAIPEHKLSQWLCP